MIRVKQSFLATVLVGLMAMVSLAAVAKMMSVQVKDAQIRDTPSFVGKIVGTLAYGDRVQVQETRGAWARVSVSSGTTGWMHTSALSSKKIVLSAGQENARVGASSDELALAGKGFNSDVEAEFKKTHRNIDFTWVDKMEKINIAPSEMQSFLKEGNVTLPKGGAP